MVSYNAEKRIITLTNGNISYVIYINPNGVLEQLYFGKYWEGQEADLAALPVRDGGRHPRGHACILFRIRRVYGDNFQNCSP